jgi:hypothetical protein
MPEADEEPQETATDVALEILQAVAEDPFRRSSYRLRARQHLRKLQRHERKEAATAIGADDEEDDDC